MKEFSKKEKRRMLIVALRRYIKKRLSVFGWIALIAIVTVVGIFAMGIMAYKALGEILPESNAINVFAVGSCWLILIFIGDGIVWGIIWFVSTEIKSIQEEFEKEEHQQRCNVANQKNAEEKM